MCKKRVIYVLFLNKNIYLTLNQLDFHENIPFQNTQI